MLRVNGVDTCYGKVQALWGVSLDIAEGELVALVGANGAGKTTLLNTISGVVHPTAGSIEFMGKPISSLPPHEIIELGVCHVPEGSRLFPDMSVRENLEMGAYPGRTWKQREETLKQVYELFPRLKEREKQLSRTLSGGEKQMLAIGRGLMSKPRLCMFDELSYGLAPVLVTEIFRVIRGLREQGITVLLIEQDVTHSMQIADRAYVLENGHICLEGDCAKLLQSDYVRKAYLGL